MENIVAQACTQGEYPIKKEWSQAAPSQGTTNSETEAETDPSQAPSEEAWPSRYLGVRFWGSRTI